MTGPGTSLHGYPAGALQGDYLRAILGLAVTGALLLFTAPSSVMFYVLLALLLLFLWFGLRTLGRQLTRIELNGEEILVHVSVPPRQGTGRKDDQNKPGRPWGWPGKKIAWRDLRDVSLRYYSTKRDRSDGWMQLTLRGGGGVHPLGTRIVLDSSVSDFAPLVAAVLREAAALPLSETTLANLAMLNDAGHNRHDGGAP